MYHYQQQPSYNPYAAADPPRYSAQYGNWPEQPGQQDLLTAHSFSGSLHQHSNSQYHQYPQYQQQYQQFPSQSQQHPSQDQQYSPQSQRPSPAPYIQRRTSAQERWDDYIASEECSGTLQENQIYVNQVTSELEQRAIADERLGGVAQRHGVDTQHAQQAERDRRLRWAREMIIQNPALCAEVYCAMSKRPAAPPRRDSSRSSTATMPSPVSGGSNSNNSSHRGSPT